MPSDRTDRDDNEPPDEAEADPASWWDESYRTEDTPWETGRPQPAIVECVDAGVVTGRVLDVGCGVGTEARYVARNGHEVVGVDFSRRAIERARRRVKEGSCGFDQRVSFRVADALALERAELGVFDTVLDCGLFHTLERRDRSAYADALATTLVPGGRVVMLEFGPDSPREWPPTRIATADVRRTFDDGWHLETVRSVPFETRRRTVDGILAVIGRME